MRMQNWKIKAPCLLALGAGCAMGQVWSSSERPNRVDRTVTQLRYNLASRALSGGGSIFEYLARRSDEMCVLNLVVRDQAAIQSLPRRCRMKRRFDGAFAYKAFTSA
jgi:hypothetical protein